MPVLSVDRDRAHVRPHQPGDKSHRQQGGDNGECREDGRTAHLIDRPGIIAPIVRCVSTRCRWMFSTTTIASSTRMPIEKISANRDTRLMVKPQAQEANSVATSVR